MIGWCVANKQARIALDVGEEAVRFSNPLLPETRSELALPLICRDQVIGAMTVQSDHAAAFTADDVTVLQTMADQLANAHRERPAIRADSAARAGIEQRESRDGPPRSRKGRRPRPKRKRPKRPARKPRRRAERHRRGQP